MKISQKTTESLNDFIPVLLFLLLISIYFYPEFLGKGLELTDVIQITGTNHEAQELREKGEQILWTNSSFGGMPIFFSSSMNLFHWIHRTLQFLLPQTFLIGTLGFIGFYILLLSFNVNRWLSFIGAFAYSFSSFNMLSLEAGHINKLFDMMLMAPVLAGVFLVYKGKIKKGAIVTATFLGMQIYYGHIQINYYLMFMILGISIMELVESIKQKMIQQYVKRSVILLAIALLAILSNIVFLWSTNDLAPSTTRGGTELTSDNKKTEGLDYDYAFSWSSGISESFTLFIPYFKGGGSQEQLSQNSASYKALIANGVPRQQANQFVNGIPLYWGTQPFTSGPIYFGAIIIFLYVLGLFVLKGPIKWWIISLTLLSLALSWGKNFPILTNFFFYNVPLYSKFRSVTMILSITELLFPFMAMLTLNEIFKGKDTKNQIKYILYSAGICAGLAFVFFALGGSLFDFEGQKDAAMQIPEWLITAIQADRLNLFRMDSIRSLILVLLSASILYYFLKEKLGRQYAIMLIAALVIIDLWTVNKRYINADNFKDTKRIERQAYKPTPADELIMKDSDAYFRVYNLSTNTFSDGITSYFHKSLGGYSAIKLQRYNEIIARHLSKGNMNVINMLNTKYIISRDNNNNIQPRRNPGALGNAWFVNEYTVVANANEEISAIDSFNPKTTAIVDKRFENLLGNIKPDSSAVIKIAKYHPMKLEFTSSSSTNQLAVFSDIYYQPGWEAKIDGNKVDHFRTNYILRGLMVPSGEHTITFAFSPKSYAYGEKIGLSASIIILLLVGINFYLIKQTERKEEKNATAA